MIRSDSHWKDGPKNCIKKEEDGSLLLVLSPYPNDMAWLGVIGAGDLLLLPPGATERRAQYTETIIDETPMSLIDRQEAIILRVSAGQQQ